MEGLAKMLGIAWEHYHAGRHAEAEAVCRELLRATPDFPEALGLLASIAMGSGALVEAERLMRRAVWLEAGSARYRVQLGLVLSRAGKYDEAIAEFESAVGIDPTFVEGLNNLGTLLKARGRTVEALAAYRRAVTLRPQFAEGHYNLGNLLKELKQFDEAIAEYRRAVELMPGFSQAYSNLATVLKDVGEVDEAVRLTRRALSIKPDLIAASNLLCTLHYSDKCTPEELYEEHARWDATFGRAYGAGARPHGNDPTPTRRIRVGYVSPDLSRHPVGRCLLPVLSHHDRAGFEIVVYSDVVREDEITAKLRACADVWRSTAAVGDGQLSELIRGDGIDVLVDLASHTNGNRLPVFARKPAPVQVTWLGMPTTTGLSAMDYRLSDPYLDPPGSPPGRYSEKTVRLPHCFWPYDRPSVVARVNGLPALRNGFVTFGCLNNNCKMSDRSLEMWAGVLAAVPGSRVLLRTSGGYASSRIASAFARAGVDPGRLEFVGHQPHEQYLATYNRIDIGLDTVPYGGHITALDSLWMGVPVVTLAGGLPVSRAGVSFCANLGLEALVAATASEFVGVAAGLAADLPGLIGYRGALRSRLECSAIMNGAEYADDLEEVFREIWVRWCRERGAGPVRSDV